MLQDLPLNSRRVLPGLQFKFQPLLFHDRLIQDLDLQLLNLFLLLQGLLLLWFHLLLAALEPQFQLFHKHKQLQKLPDLLLLGLLQVQQFHKDQLFHNLHKHSLQDHLRLLFQQVHLQPHLSHQHLQHLADLSLLQLPKEHKEFLRLYPQFQYVQTLHLELPDFLKQERNQCRKVVQSLPTPQFLAFLSTQRSKETKVHSTFRESPSHLSILRTRRVFQRRLLQPVRHHSR